MIDTKSTRSALVSTIAKKLIEIAKAKDSSHPVTLTAIFPEVSIHTGVLNHLDLIRYNSNQHLKSQLLARFENYIEEDNKTGKNYHGIKLDEKRLFLFC